MVGFESFYNSQLPQKSIYGHGLVLKTKDVLMFFEWLQKQSASIKQNSDVTVLKYAMPCFIATTGVVSLII